MTWPERALALVAVGWALKPRKVEWVAALAVAALSAFAAWRVGLL